MLISVLIQYVIMNVFLIFTVYALFWKLNIANSHGVVFTLNHCRYQEVGRLLRNKIEPLGGRNRKQMREETFRNVWGTKRKTDCRRLKSCGRENSRDIKRTVNGKGGGEADFMSSISIQMKVPGNF